MNSLIRYENSPRITRVCRDPRRLQAVVNTNESDKRLPPFTVVHVTPDEEGIVTSSPAI